MINAMPPVRRRGRPPKSEGDYRETKDVLCRAGLAALTQKGFSATGIEEILKTAGVPKGSFYNFFSSKEAFGTELVRQYADNFARKLDRYFLDDSLSPLARLQAFCADAEASMARYGFRRGCLIGNLGQEMEALPEAFRAQLVDVLLDWEARTAACIEAAKVAGEISPRIDAAQWAAFFWIGWEGAVLRAKLERRGEPLQAYAKFFVMSLRA
ncbi:acrylate utilization transcriptional regulator AcuR [Denitromonas halophila]|nr:TetR/AcrR family transcriptional regulator [Denitromonas halophila]